MSRPLSTSDLSQPERRFLIAMRELGFGRFEFLRIESGELALDPWPITVRGIKFGSLDEAALRSIPGDFELKTQVAEFFEYVRAVEVGEIRFLELRHGLPFFMEIEHRKNGGCCD
jgi:hypothetical protein